MKQKFGFTLGADWLLSLFLVSMLISPPLGRSAPRLQQEKTPESELIIGRSAPFSGLSAQTAKDYQDGILAWFSEVNRNGGIHKRKLRLVSIDDNYKPARTLANTHKLIHQEKAIALIGFFGTPNSKLVIPLIEKVGIPFVAPVTGARDILNPYRPMVFNLRASYQAEIDKIINHLVRDARHRIAIFHVTDAYGIDGLRSAKIALARHNLKPVVVSSLPRNSIDTYQVAQKIVNTKANAVLSINTFATSASLSRNLSSMGSKAQLMNLSPVGIEGLQDALPGGRADGIGISQVFPFPWNRRVPVIAQYQEMMQRQKVNAHYGYTSLEGFLAARWLTAALEKAGPNPSREKLAEAFRKLGNIDLGGFKLHLKPGSNQASQLVELTFLKSQRWGP